MERGGERSKGGARRLMKCAEEKREKERKKEKIGAAGSTEKGHAERHSEKIASAMTRFFKKKSAKPGKRWEGEKRGGRQHENEQPKRILPPLPFPAFPWLVCAVIKKSIPLCRVHIR